MSRDFESSTGEDITYTTPATLDYSSGCTLSIWCNQESTSTTHKRAIEIWNSSAEFVALLQFDNGQTGQTQVVFQRSDSSNVVRSTDPFVSTGTWHHWLVTYDGGTGFSGIHTYRDGSELTYQTESNGTGSPRNADGAWYVGMRSTIPDRYYDGKLAEIAVWNRVISAGEIALLAAKYSPLHMPDFIFYAPLIRSAQNYTSNNAVTLNGTTVAEHPPIIYPATPYIVVPAAAAPAGNIPEFMHHYQQQQQAG